MQSDIVVEDRKTLEQVIADISMTNTCLDFQWKFEVEELRNDSDCAVYNDANLIGWFVNVAFQRPDTATGELGTGRGRKEFIARGSYESSVVKTCWLLIELVVRHELMEAFRYRNARIFNPHNSVHALASIQQ